MTSRLAPPLALSLLLLAACSEAPPGETPPRAVRVAPARLEPVAGQARYSGALGPLRQVDLAFRVPGRLGTLKRVGEGAGARPLQEGDVVRQGEVLAALDLDDLRRQAAAAQASVSAARAQHQAAGLALAQADREVTRLRALATTGDVSRADLERAEAGRESAQANRDAADANLQARLEQHGLTRNALADASLRAPFDGVVARVNVEPGQTVPPNVPALSVMDTSGLKLTVGLPDARLGAVSLGMRLPVSVEALPGQPRDGVVTGIAPSADPVLRTYAVVVSLTDVEGLRPGMTATVRLGRGRASSVAVPLAALVRGDTPESLALFVLGDDGLVHRRAVGVFDLLENDALLESGLEAGERVVVEGAPWLRDGEHVEVVP